MAPFGRTVGIVFSWLVSTQLLLYPYTKISPAQTVALIVAGTGVGLHDGFAYLCPRRTIGERKDVTKKRGLQCGRIGSSFAAEVSGLNYGETGAPQCLLQKSVVDFVLDKKTLIFQRVSKRGSRT